MPVTDPGFLNSFWWLNCEQSSAKKYLQNIIIDISCSLEYLLKFSVCTSISKKWNYFLIEIYMLFRDLLYSAYALSLSRSVVYRSLVSIQFSLALPPPSSCSCIWKILYAFLSPDSRLFYQMFFYRLFCGFPHVHCDACLPVISSLLSVFQTQSHFLFLCWFNMATWSFSLIPLFSKQLQLLRNDHLTVFVSESSWFVEKIIVKESINSLFEFQFPCHSWLECSAGSSLACKKIPCRGKFVTGPLSCHFCC